MADQQLKLVITTDATGAITGIKNFTGEVKKMETTSSSMADNIKKNWLEVTAAVATATVAVRQVMEYVSMGAKAQQAEDSFRRVASSAGESADKIVAAMKRAAVGTVDDSDIMQKAVKGMILGMSGDQMVKIMETARLSARVAGEDVKTAYEGITDAIATGMPKALKKYGLISKEEMAVVSAALKAGVKDVNLYEIAMLNAGIQAAKFGTVHDTMAEKLQRSKAVLNDYGETIGKEFIEVMDKATQTASNFWLTVLAPKQAVIRATAAYAVSVAVRTAAAIKEAQGKPAQAQALRDSLNPPETVDMLDAGINQRQIERAEKDKAAKIKNIEDKTAAITHMRDVLAAETSANKSAYDEQIAAQDHWLNMSKMGSHDDLKNTAAVIETKKELLNGWYDAQAESIYNTVKDATVQTKTLEALWKEYNLNWTKFTYEGEVTRANITKKAYDEAVSGIEKEIELGVKLTSESIQQIKERGALARTLYKDMKGYGGEYYAEAVALIEEQTNKFRLAKLNESEIAKWAAEQLRIADIERLKASSYFTDNMAAGMMEYAHTASKAGNQIAESMNKVFDGMTDALTDFVMTGKMDFGSLANSIIKDLIRIQIQSQITGPLSGALSGFIKGAFGGGNVEMGQSFTGGVDYGFMHSGGIVGTESSFSKALPPSTFANAPRYHSGLKPDEFPAILQKGEGVFTKGQMQAMGGGNQSIRVVINNTSSQKVEASKSDASFDLSGMVINIVLDAVQRNKMGLRDVLAGGR